MPDLKQMNDTIRVGSIIDDKNGRFAEEYEIEMMEGDFSRVVTVIEETPFARYVNGVEKVTMIRKMKQVKESFDKGYMIYYPQAHSVFVAADDVEQLKALGIPLDDDNEVIMQHHNMPNQFALTSKEAVIKAGSKRSRSTAGGIAEAMKG